MSAREFELKFDLRDEDQLVIEHLLSAQAQHSERHHLVATYFDTPRHMLRKHGHVLRIRKQGLHFVQTIKDDSGEGAGLFSRQEWEQTVPDTRPMLDDVQPFLAAVGKRELAQLAPLFVVDVMRLACVLNLGDTTVEAAVDRGEARAPTGSQAISELELELKGGGAAGLFDLARRLDSQVPLRLGVCSKPERGYALLAGSSSKALKAGAACLDPLMPAREAFRQIAMQCIRQYRINEDLLLVGHEVEAVHQARVALRRLQTALALFKPLFDDDERADLLRSEFRSLGSDLGEVRNLDVLMKRLGNSTPASVQKAHDIAFDHFSTILLSSRTRLLLLDLAEWLTIGDWIASPKGDWPVARLAADALDSARRRFRRAAKGMTGTSLAQWHPARLAAKRLRYAGEFFAALCVTAKEQRRHTRWMKVLQGVQEELGILNDLLVGETILTGLGEPDLQGVDPQTVELLQSSAKPRCAKLRAAKPFWLRWEKRAANALADA